MVDAGLYNGDNESWIKNPQIVEIGTKVTNIGGATFLFCNSLTNVTIPDSVMSIGEEAFSDC